MLEREREREAFSYIIGSKHKSTRYLTRGNYAGGGHGSGGSRTMVQTTVFLKKIPLEGAECLYHKHHASKPSLTT
jgi:hypothetical protein